MKYSNPCIRFTAFTDLLRNKFNLKIVKVVKKTKISKSI